MQHIKIAKDIVEPSIMSVCNLEKRLKSIPSDKVWFSSWNILISNNVSPMSAIVHGSSAIFSAIDKKVRLPPISPFGYSFNTLHMQVFVNICLISRQCTLALQRILLLLYLNLGYCRQHCESYWVRRQMQWLCVISWLWIIIKFVICMRLCSPRRNNIVEVWGHHFKKWLHG